MAATPKIIDERKELIKQNNLLKIQYAHLSTDILFQTGKLTKMRHLQKKLFDLILINNALITRDNAGT